MQNVEEQCDDFYMHVAWDALTKRSHERERENHLKPWWHHWARTSLETCWLPKTIEYNRSATVIGSCCCLSSFTLLFPGIIIFSAASLNGKRPSDLSVPLPVVRVSTARGDDAVVSLVSRDDLIEEGSGKPDDEVTNLLCSAAAARSSRRIRRSLASGLSMVPPWLSPGLLRFASGADCRLIRNARWSSSSSWSPIAKTKSSAESILAFLQYKTREEEEEDVETSFPETSWAFA